MPPKRNNIPTLKSLSPSIQALLSRLRARIRWCVLLEGVATAFAWLLLTFWVALAVDYLPVMFGLSELSRTARAIFLVMVSALIAGILYRLAFRRVFVRLKNPSMAMLIERRYPEFYDSLLTTVNRESSNSEELHVDSAMLERTRLQAESLLPGVDLAKIVTSRPLKRSATIAGLLLVSVIAFAVVQPSSLKLAGQRLYLLQEKPWPRRCQLEIVGIKVKRENPVEGIEELGQTLLPVNGVFQVAKGSTLTLMVRAAGGGGEGDRRLPDSCAMHYQTEDGSGAQTFKRIGVPRDGFQLYSLDGQPLRGVLKDIEFEVRGGDHRIGPFKISAVEEPDVFETKLACRYPPYITDASSGRWFNRTIDWTGQARFPEGTIVTILAKANHPLKKVYVFDRNLSEMKTIQANGVNFSLEIPALKDAVSLQFYLCDQFGLVSERPHSVNIEPIEDQPPIVHTRLSGIGTAVTPDVQIPISGAVKDDYGLRRTWLEIEIADTEVIDEPISPDARGGIDAVIDFKQRRQDVGPIYKLPAGDGNTLQLVLKSEDKFDLADSPNLGIGDRYSLDIVSPNQLVRILERLEVGQRRRIEQIYLEMADARNYLSRARSEQAMPNSSNQGLVEPGDREAESEAASEPGDKDGQPQIRKQELRLLFAQRGILQIDKSTQEVLGSAEAFENLRLQLINNRIDSEDRKNRFSHQIIAPLRLIGNQSMQQLKESVVHLEGCLRDLQISPQDVAVSDQADQLANAAIERADIVLNQLDAVLNVLIKYETQNELLEIVRQMIRQQQALKERTKKERQRNAFEGLLD